MKLSEIIKLLLDAMARDGDKDVSRLSVVVNRQGVRKHTVELDYDDERDPH